MGALRIAMVSSELAPWCKTGGLGDVLGALPGALERASEGSVQTACFLPLYRKVRQRAAAEGVALRDTGVVARTWLAGHTLQARILTPDQPGPRLYLVDAPGLYDREGIYDGERGAFGDNAYRFAFLCLAALETATALMGGHPDVFHAHDWQAGLLPVYLRARFQRAHPRARSVFTIHNLAYQGVFAARSLPALGLGGSLMHADAMEYHGNISLLKGGIALADAVTAVSPTYAREIQTPAFGCGLDGFLRHAPRRLAGVLNGIDESVWGPAADPYIAANYSADDLSGKAACRRALIDEAGLRPNLGEPILGVISRFTGQKGLDLVADLVPELPRTGARLVVLGTGQPSLEGRFRRLAAQFPEHLKLRVDFDEALAHRINAGADVFLMPSRFEPCGLNQMYAMACGTVPIVHAVGGLRDTVHDPGDDALCRGRGTGFCFEPATTDGLRWALRRAIGIFRHHPEGWGRIMRAGMRRDWSWDRSARAYLSLYSSLVGA